MKPAQQWQFSSRAKDIDVGRILKEAGTVKEVVRLTVGGKVFTIAPRVLADRHGVTSQALGILTVNTKFDNTYGDLRVTGLDPTNSAIWSPNRAHECLIFDQDIAGKLVRSVVTKVETF